MQNNVMPRILIVDDEQEITEILADLLSENHDCHKAGSAEQALLRLQETEFQLVISDITMAGMTGLEMIPHVKSFAQHVVVISADANGWCNRCTTTRAFDTAKFRPAAVGCNAPRASRLDR
jgi:DNA-binding NtrC family response regulator